MSEQKNKYLIAFLPSSNKDYDSISILNTNNTLKEARDFLSELIEKDIKELKITECKYCKNDMKCQQQKCANSMYIDIDFTYEMYDANMTINELQNVGINIYHNYTNSTFLIITVNSSTKRGTVLGQLQNSIL